MKKGNKQPTFGRITLRPMEPPRPRSRSERILRPILVVWSNVCDMDKGTICEFGNASHHDSEVVVVESDTAEEVFEFKNS